MSVVIVGGNECMVCAYQDICKKYGCKAKVFPKEKSSMKKKIGTPDLLILFTNPLDDVKAFICNGGRNCKCVGYWKVYGNEKEAAQTFARFKKCSSIYSKLWNGGRSVRQLTVAV